MSDTVRVYDELVEDYVRIADDLPSTLDEFVQKLRPNARVLDLGCGPGHHARIMADLGHQVLAMDASAEMIKRAAAQPGVRAVQATYDDISGLGEFDGIWANYSLLHARRADLARHLADIRSICAPDAIFSVTLKIGEGEATDKLGRFYSYYGEPELVTFLTRAKFTIGHICTGAVTGLAGHVEPWICIQAHA